MTRAGELAIYLMSAPALLSLAYWLRFDAPIWGAF